MIRIITKLSLTGFGLVLGLIGAALMLSPQAFLATSEVIVDSDPGLMSELAAPGAVLLLAATFMILGAFKPSYSNLGLVLGTAVYGSYGVGRVISAVFHGVPSQSLVNAMIVEFGIAASLLALHMLNNRKARRRSTSAGGDKGLGYS